MKQKKLPYGLTALLLCAMVAIAACGGGGSGGATTTGNAEKATTAATTAATTTAKATEKEAAKTEAATTTAKATEAAKTTTAKATEAATTAQGGGDAAAEKGPYWLTDEKVTYSFLIPTVNDLNNFPFYAHIEEITNVHINYIALTGDNLSSYINLMWASGDMPDIMRGISSTDFAIYSDQGQFFPINSIWKDNMPNLMTILEKYPEIGNRLTMPDGNVYSLTGIQGGTIQATSGAWIYQPWLDKLGLPVPSTIQEFVDTLTAFKEQDPNGNGAKDEVPFAFSPASWRQGPVHGWFGCSQDWLIQNGVVSYSPVTENYKTYVKFMNHLWNAGLFDPEVYTQEPATFLAKSAQNPIIHGVIMDYGKYITVPPAEYDNYTLLGPMESGTTPCGILNTRGDTEYQLWGIIALNAKVKNPELLLRWFDVFFDPYYGAQALFGMDGVHIEKNADGVFKYVDEIPAPYQNREEWFMATHYNQVIDYSATELASLLTSANLNITEMREIYQKYKDRFINEPLPAMTLQTWQEAEKLASYPDIAMLKNSVTPQWIAGEKDVDADWDGYLSQMKQLGVEEYTAAYQEFYTRIAKQLGW